MKMKKKILIFLAVLAGIMGTVVLSYYGFRAWYNSSPWIRWVISSDEEDTTERHRQNMQEHYQILPDHILLIPDSGEDYGGLVLMDRRGKNRKRIFPGRVESFIEVGQRIYYFSQDNYLDDDRTSGFIGCYDLGTGESQGLVEDPDIRWFTVYQDQILYIREDEDWCLKDVCCCSQSGENQDVLYQFTGAGFEYYDIYLTGGSLLFLGEYEEDDMKMDFNTAMLLLPLQSPKVIELAEWEMDFYNTYLLDGCLYAGVYEEDEEYADSEMDDGTMDEADQYDLYRLVPDLQTQTASAEKLLSVTLPYSVGGTIHCRAGKLYDGRFQCIYEPAVRKGEGD